jgi:predicted RNA-binding Zn ribbon-like protein
LVASKSYYEELIEKSASGVPLTLEPLVERVHDLFREKIILQAKRRAAVRGSKRTALHEIDQQLAAVRREISETTIAIEKHGGSVDSPDPHEKEQSLEDAFFAEYETRQRMLDELTRRGDAETAEALKALFAERQARLFKSDDEAYT